MVAFEDDFNVFDALFTLMETLDVEEQQEVNFYDVRQSRKNYSKNELMLLAKVLIDNFYELVKVKDTLYNVITMTKTEKSTLIGKVSELKEKLSLMSLQNDESIGKCITGLKGRSEEGRSQLDLKERLNKTKYNLSAIFEKNKELEKEPKGRKYLKNVSK